MADFLLACHSLIAKPNYLCAVSNARLRSAPNLKSQTVQLVALGESLQMQKKSTGKIPLDGATAHWFHFTTDQGKQGWMHGSLVRAYTSANYGSVVISIAR